jgi:hypothetical protein
VLWEFDFGCLHIVPRMVDYHNIWVPTSIWGNFTEN